MPEERIIPAIESVAEFVIKINGTEIPRSVPKLLMHVNKTANKISYAKIVIEDGDAATGEFPQTDGDLFVPGSEVEIAAGDPDNQTSIFKGIIVKQSISIKNNTAPQLIVECRHKAVKTTIARKSNCFHDITDSDAMEQLLSDAGITGKDVESTSLTHKELVQYNCTGWDFILSRAGQNGQLVFTNDENVVIKKPDYSAEPALSLLHGATIIELDAEMDSRNQYTAVKSKAWDMANQAIAESDASEPGIVEEGNLSASELADAIGINEFVLNHGGAIGADELKAWADAQLLTSRMSKIRGRVKFEGIATLNPGDMLELNKISERFSGKALVTGVRHDYDRVHGWKTQAQFGHDPKWFIEENEVSAPKAGGLLPGVIGLHTGIVTDNEDPQGEMRVRVKIPFINADDDGVWARIAQADAGNNRGLFFRPEISDEVVLGFLYDDPRQPVILGMLHSSALTSPLSPSNDNHQKGYTSREQMKFIFDDEKKSIQIETPAGNKITISDDAKGITIEDQNSNKIEMGTSGIKISSPAAIEITAQTDLKLTAANLTLAGNASLGMSGSGSSKLESSGVLELKGSLVKIN